MRARGPSPALGLLLLASGGLALALGPEPFGDAGDYDVLVFARFWMGEPANETLCGTYAAGNLTVHGVWPQYRTPRDTHGWPQFCNTTGLVAEVNPKVADYFALKWGEVAPAYPAATALRYRDLASHEWAKHGTCWNAASDDVAAGDVDSVVALQKQFFQISLDLNVAFPTPGVLRDAWSSGQNVSVKDLQEAFGGADYVGMQCNGGSATKAGQNQLTMISLCFTRDLEQIKCPDSFIQEEYSNNCGMGSVDNIGVAYHCNGDNGHT